MCSKLSLFFQNIPSWGKSVVNAGNIHWVEVIDPDGSNSWPNARTIGRLWVGGDNVEAQYYQLGATGADAYFALCEPRYRAASWVHCWIGPNEPNPLYNAAVANQYAEFAPRWVELMHQKGYRAVVGSFSVGWPDIGQAPMFRAMMQAADYLGLHEYAAPTMQSGNGYWTLRYRRTIKELKDAGCRVPPILITECGIDGGLVGRGRTGWKGFCDKVTYQAQLAWYLAEINKDAEVLCAAPFVSGPSPDWVSFDVDEGLARWIAAQPDQATAPPMPAPVPTAQPAIRLQCPIRHNPTVTQEFGGRAVNYAPYPGHPAQDLSANIGTPVRAAHDGVVYHDSTYGPAFGTYCWVKGQYGDGKVMWTMYNHLSAVLADDREEVKVGNIIALSGNSGTSTTGAHLDWRIETEEPNPQYQDYMDKRYWWHDVRKYLVT